SVRKSEDSNYSVRIVRYSNGRTADQARYYASLIDYPIVQKDVVLYIPDGFILPKDVPFRNQHLVLQIFVPAGGNIDFRNGLDDLKDAYFDEEDWEVNDEQKVFHMSVEGGLMPDVKIEVKDQH
ncbi:MAG TPA: hypothetical protein VK084_10630, partial [Chitinophagaceae bacterium]|nr:hypothetical protein [Chitinophagaceae bacterium]